jgi:hypothetical protein
VVGGGGVADAGGWEGTRRKDARAASVFIGLGRMVKVAVTGKLSRYVP